MKRDIVRTTFFVATLFLSLGAVALAQNDGNCSNNGVAGDWAYSFTGTIFFPAPTGAVPFAAVGTATLDRAGHWSGKQTSNLGGTISQDTLKGTVTVNSDCTATQTNSVYDQSGTTLLRTTALAIVFDDSEREFRAIFTSLKLEPSGESVPTVITLNARKVFPGK